MLSRADCIPNIGPSKRRKRLALGVVAFGIGAVIAAVLAAFDTPRLWRIPLFLPFWAAALGFFQAWDKT